MDDHFDQAAHDDQDEDIERHLRTHAIHRRLVPSSSNSNYPDDDYQPPSVSTIEEPLRNDRLHHPNGLDDHVNARPNSSSSNAQQYRDGVLYPQQYPRQHYTDLARTALFPSTPDNDTSAASQRFPSTPQNSQKPLLSNFTPSDRSLPSQNVTDENLDDAYVAFILYCNPAVQLSTDSVELRKGFRSPPKSDGKNFSTYTLLELIRKFENKEIKTWTQLAIQLGVDPPMREKNQSAQKVQQYAVRLKRWMHAMHVDAFFEYCLGKQHNYYMQIPPLHAPFPEVGRDGVPFEEDLALRALHPESRPKRGRRKTEDKETDLDKGMSPAKRPHLDTSIDTADLDSFENTHSALFPNNSINSNREPDDMDRYVNNLDPWTAASAITPESLTTGQTLTPNLASSASAGQHFRWRLNARENHSASSPQSNHNVTPLTPHPPDSAFDHPHSAITPSSSGAKSRARRRHGPAVSSAWPGGGNPASGKLRGRPPSNRSVRDGPFSTFPANPKTREGPVIDLQGSSQVSTPVDHRETSHPLSQPLHFSSQQESTPSLSRQQRSDSRQQNLQSKPSGLHLQVPQRIGGPVQLATPTVLVNGGNDHITSPSSLGGTEHRPTTSYFDDIGSGVGDGDDSFSTHEHQTITLDFGINDLIREFAAQLMKAKTIGDMAPLNFKRAKKLSANIIMDFRRRYIPTNDDLGGEAQYLIKCADWLGLQSNSKTDIKNLQIRCSKSPDAKINGSKSSIRSKDGEEDLNEEQQLDGAEQSKRVGSATGETSYYIAYSLSMPPFSADISLSATVSDDDHLLNGIDETDEPQDPELGSDGDADEAAWKKRYMALRHDVQCQHAEMAHLRRKVLDAVL
ncbi:MAG: hypothetical protein M1837_001307 [Sclerophora amabilis]|nr:MAG: hypothetical protein M1837_001307 [Sclerophora amabilis]